MSQTFIFENKRRHHVSRNYFYPGKKMFVCLFLRIPEREYFDVGSESLRARSLELVFHVDDVSDGGNARQQLLELGQEIVGSHHNLGLRRNNRNSLSIQNEETFKC